MKILLIHQHFNTPDSGGPLRSYYLASALVRSGHRVVVITSSAGKTTTPTTFDNIEVVYLPIPYNNRFKFNARAWSFLRFAWSAIRAASRYKDFDLCYAMSVPLTVGLCARWLRWRYGMPYWFEVGDLWPDAPIELGYIRSPLFKWALHRFERNVYRKAIGVVALSEPIRQAIEKKTPNSRIKVIPNMSDCDFYKPKAKNPTAEPKYPIANKFVVSYLGALGAANGLQHLLRCAQAAGHLPVHFMICGDGAESDMLKEAASRMNLDNVTFTGLLNRSGVAEVLDSSDAVFVSYRPARILETGSPNKYFDGLAAGKLMIVNVGGWIRAEVESSLCGFFVDPAEPETFVHKVKPYLQDKQQLATAQQRARELAEKSYSRSIISARFAALFNPS